MAIEVETGITINGVKYIPESEIQKAFPGTIGDCRIIVADKGWVFVGNCQDHEDGSVTISNARNIRNWGTTRGLGELVNGPIQNKTKYDDYGTVRCTPVVQINVVKGW